MTKRKALFIIKFLKSIRFVLRLVVVASAFGGLIFLAGEPLDSLGCGKELFLAVGQNFLIASALWLITYIAFKAEEKLTSFFKELGMK